MFGKKMGPKFVPLETYSVAKEEEFILNGDLEGWTNWVMKSDKPYRFGLYGQVELAGVVARIVVNRERLRNDG